jgi:outer membrane protein TolC
MALLLIAVIGIFIFTPVSQAVEIDRSLPPELKGEEIKLSLKEAVELAMKRNLTVIFQKFQVDMSLEKITEEKGIFDPNLKLNLSAGKQEVPIADVLYPRGYYAEDFASGSAGIEGKILTGAKYGVDLSLERNKSTSQVQTLSPRYSSRLNLSLTQPLLKDFGIGITKTRIRMAEEGTKAARYDVKDTLVRTVGQVEEAYWNIVYAMKNLDVQMEGLDLAREVLKIAEIKVKAGEIAHVGLIEARAGVAEREGNVIAAEGELQKAEYDFKLLLDIPDSTGRIYPEDLPEKSVFVPSVQESINMAYDNRADVRALEYRVEQKKLEERFDNNQRLPRLDIVGEYGYRGISGTPSDVLDSSGQPLGDRIINTPFEGKTSWQDSFDEYFKEGGFLSWTLGLKLEIPIGGRAAGGRYRQASIERGSLEHKMLILKEKISAEVKKELLDINTGSKRMDAARAYSALAQEQLNVERRKLDAGDTSFYEFLKRQRDFTDAKVKEIKALIDYNIAWSKFRVEQGIALNRYGIEFYPE